MKSILPSLTVVAVLCVCILSVIKLARHTSGSVVVMSEDLHPFYEDDDDQLHAFHEPEPPSSPHTIPPYSPSPHPSVYLPTGFNSAQPVASLPAPRDRTVPAEYLKFPVGSACRQHPIPDMEVQSEEILKQHPSLLPPESILQRPIRPSNLSAAHSCGVDDAGIPPPGAAAVVYRRNSRVKYLFPPPKPPRCSRWVIYEYVDYQEFGHLFHVVLPYLWYLHRRCHAIVSTSPLDSTALFWFSLNHTEIKQQRTIAAPVHLPTELSRGVFGTNALMGDALWYHAHDGMTDPLPWRRMFINSNVAGGPFSVSGRRTVVIVNVYVSTYYQRVPAIFIDVASLRQIIRAFVAAKWFVVYHRASPRYVSSWDTEKYEDLKESAVVRDAGAALLTDMFDQQVSPSAANHITKSFNEFQLHLLANSDAFIAVKGGATYLTMGFGGTGISLHLRACCKQSHGAFAHIYSGQQQIAVDSNPDLVKAVHVYLRMLADGKAPNKTEVPGVTSAFAGAPFPILDCPLGCGPGICIAGACECPDGTRPPLCTPLRCAVECHRPGGVCIDGTKCVCLPTWSGPGCSQQPCGPHGVQVDGNCTCPLGGITAIADPYGLNRTNIRRGGFWGRKCQNIVCPIPYHKRAKNVKSHRIPTHLAGSTEKRACSSQGVCNPNGTCACDAGWRGGPCDERTK